MVVYCYREIINSCQADRRVTFTTLFPITRHTMFYSSYQQFYWLRMTFQPFIGAKHLRQVGSL